MTQTHSKKIGKQRTSLVIVILLFASLTSFSAVVAAPNNDDEPGSTTPVLTPAADGQLRLERGRHSILDLYRQWGEAYDIQVLFDPKIRDQDVELELGSESGEGSLALLTQTAGHFATPLDAKTVMIATDTPQNRRHYEPMAIQTFAFQNIHLKDAMTLLRSLLGLKHVAAQADLNSLTVRDTAAKVALTERLISMIDQPLAEAAIDVELLFLDAADRARLDAADGLPQRLSTTQLAELRRVSRSVTSHRLSVVEGKKGQWAIMDKVPTKHADGDSSSILTVGFELDVRPQIHDDSQELSLDLSLGVRDAALGNTAIDASERRQDVTSSTRLASGETFLLSGFLPLDEAAGPSLLLSRLGLPAEGPAELLMILTPTVVRARGYDERDLEALFVGTESHLTLASRVGD